MIIYFTALYIHTHEYLFTLLPAFWLVQFNDVTQRNNFKYEKQPAIRSTPRATRLNS